MSGVGSERGRQGAAAELVSVIIPTRDYGHFIADGLRSVVAQGYRPLEIVVVDDGSTDGTREVVAGVVRSSGASPGNVGLRVVRLEGRGLAAARNAGLAAAGGGYVMFLDADDLLLPEAVAQLVAGLEADGADMAVGGWVNFECRAGGGRSARHGEPGRLRTAFPPHPNPLPKGRGDVGVAAASVAIGDVGAVTASGARGDAEAQGPGHFCSLSPRGGGRGEGARRHVTASMSGYPATNFCARPFVGGTFANVIASRPVASAFMLRAGHHRFDEAVGVSELLDFVLGYGTRAPRVFHIGAAVTAIRSHGTAHRLSVAHDHSDPVHRLAIVKRWRRIYLASPYVTAQVRAALDVLALDLARETYRRGHGVDDVLQEIDFRNVRALGLAPPSWWLHQVAGRETGMRLLSAYEAVRRVAFGAAARWRRPSMWPWLVRVEPRA